MNSDLNVMSSNAFRGDHLPSAPLYQWRYTLAHAAFPDVGPSFLPNEPSNPASHVFRAGSGSSPSVWPSADLPSTSAWMEPQ